MEVFYEEKVDFGIIGSFNACYDVMQQEGGSGPECGWWGKGI
jgi:hypothetical protein